MTMPDAARDAFAAARAAVADGEAIVRRTREQLRLTERVGDGPLTIAWRTQQHERPAPTPKAEPEYDGSETYLLTIDDEATVRAAVAMLALARLTKRPALRKAAYADIGRHLAELRRDRDKSHFADLVKDECGISVRRAYEFMAMARGDKAIEKLRSETKARVRKSRANKGLTDDTRHKAGRETRRRAA
jgi:hypothetical protein